MTLKEIQDGGIDDGTAAFEETPDEALAMEEPKAGAEQTRIVAAVVRHLAVGASLATLCGLPKEGLATAHPSKAKRTDCLACRDAYRKGRVPPADGGFKTGDRVEFPDDGSGWLVKSVRPSGADLLCQIDGSHYKRGATTTVSTGSALRVFTEGEWAAAARAGRPKAEEPPGPPKAKERAPSKWAPTKADVDAVRRFRALGRSYISIETEMGWPDGHGNRPFRIMKGAWQYDSLKEK